MKVWFNEQKNLIITDSVEIITEKGFVNFSLGKVEKILVKEY